MMIAAIMVGVIGWTAGYVVGFWTGWTLARPGLGPRRRPAGRGAMKRVNSPLVNTDRELPLLILGQGTSRVDIYAADLAPAPGLPPGGAGSNAPAVGGHLDVQA